jgi:hypothetical protein
MAKMGKREGVKQNPAAKSLDSGAGFLGLAPWVNLIVSPVRIHTTATLGFAPMSFGVPIMREGFVTETGFLRTTAQD